MTSWTRTANGVGRPAQRMAVVEEEPQQTEAEPEAPAAGNGRLPRQRAVSEQEREQEPRMRPAGSGNHVGNGSLDDRRAAGQEECYAKLVAMIEARRFDATEPPPPPRAIYSLDGHVIATRQNLGTITAAKSAGKSAVIGACWRRPRASRNATTWVLSLRTPTAWQSCTTTRSRRTTTPSKCLATR